MALSTDGMRTPQWAWLIIEIGSKKTERDLPTRTVLLWGARPVTPVTLTVTTRSASSERQREPGSEFSVETAASLIASRRTARASWAQPSSRAPVSSTMKLICRSASPEAQSWKLLASTSCPGVEMSPRTSPMMQSLACFKPEVRSEPMASADTTAPNSARSCSS